MKQVKAIQQLMAVISMLLKYAGVITVVIEILQFAQEKLTPLLSGAQPQNNAPQDKQNPTRSNRL